MGRVPKGRGWAGVVAVVSRMAGAASVPTRRPHPPPFRVQLLCLIGESFGEHSREVCGAVINIRAKGDKIAVWTREAENQEGVLHIG